MIRKENIIYQGTSISEFNRIRDCLDCENIKYKYYVMDTASITNLPAYMYFLMSIFYLAPRAFRGSANIQGNELKTYIIVGKKQDVKWTKVFIK